MIEYSDTIGMLTRQYDAQVQRESATSLSTLTVKTVESDDGKEVCNVIVDTHC